MHPHRFIVATGLLFGISVAVAFGFDAYYSHRAALAAGEREVTKSAIVLADRVRQMLISAEKTLAAAAVARQALRRDSAGYRADAHRVLRALAEASDAVADIAWFEADGSRHVTSQRPDPEPANFANRDFFRVHVESPDNGLFVGPPQRAMVDGRWITPLSRRMVDAEGRFAGVVGGTFDTNYLQSVLERFRAANGASYAIILKSGHFFGRTPATARIGGSAGDTALFKHYLPRADHGTYNATSVSGGDERIFHYRTIADRPIVVVASLGRREVLAAWYGRIRVTGSLTALALFGAFVATWLIYAQARRLRRERRDALEARRAAEHASRSKSEFLAHMSHELRTPMNAVIGFTEMMSKEIFGPVGSPKYREYLGDIAVSGQHLLHVVNNILDLAKVEAGKWEMEDEGLDLRDICESTMQMVRERARSSGVAVSTDPAAPAIQIRADRRLMRQIVINLLTNGIKFTERGGKVVLSWSVRPDGDLDLTVADTGVGMTEEDCRRVLQPFGRGSAELARTRHDTGLGLSICRQFAEMHGGRLEISSRPGVGTTVNVILPRARVTEAPGRSVAAA